MSSSSNGRPGRAVALLNGSVATAMVVVLAALALLLKPPSPPSIAEFAPQAQQQIEEAPDEQSADVGAPAAGPRETIVIEETPTGVAPPEVAPPEVIEEQEFRGVPSALNCIKWPDGSVTQTFDPQSPPCIATWDDRQGNGGATSQGVTATEILVAIPRNSLWPGERGAQERMLATFFNTHYQFYGRQIRLVHVELPPEAETATPEVRRAMLEATLAVKPFAAIELSAAGSPATWQYPLADAGIISTTNLHPLLTLEAMRARAPYLWSYGQPGDQVERHFAEFACGSLAGRNAEYAGAAFRNRTRSWAIMQSADPDARMDKGVLLAGLSGCGIEPVVVEYQDSSDSLELARLFADLQSRGVTTIIPRTGGAQLTNLLNGADQADYEPEWTLVASGYNQHAENYGTSHHVPASQAAHLFGLASTNKILPNELTPFFQAQLAVDPSRTKRSEGRTLYMELSVLAAGIQMAGPNLTPETFAEGLRSTRFPNPSAGAAPYYQARADFSITPSLIDDVGVFWHDVSQTNSETGAGGGGLCWVDRGRRWTLRSWDRDIRPFQGDCR